MRSAAPLDAASMSIGELSRRTGVNVETIRYYERIGMMPHPPRTASGRRLYDQMERRILTFIRRARELGFTLGEVRGLLGHQACVEVRDLAARHLAKVRANIADLKAMEGVLVHAVHRCDEGEPTNCPLLDALSARWFNRDAEPVCDVD